jgi:hypothetical protein
VLVLQRRDDGGDRPGAPALEECVREYPGPGVEQLDRFRARLDLALKELGDGGREHVDQGLEPVGIAQRPLLNDGMLRCAAAASLDLVEAGDAQELGYVRCRADGGRQDRAVAGPVLQGLPQRGGDLRKVREEDGGIERETADRLQGDLDGMLGRIAEPHHAPGGLTDPVILGQVPPGLPHQPDRRPLGPLSSERAQEQFPRPDDGPA